MTSFCFGHCNAETNMSLYVRECYETNAFLLKSMFSHVCLIVNVLVLRTCLGKPKTENMYQGPLCEWPCCQVALDAYSEEKNT